MPVGGRDAESCPFRRSGSALTLEEVDLVTIHPHVHLPARAGVAAATELEKEAFQLAAGEFRVPWRSRFEMRRRSRAFLTARRQTGWEVRWRSRSVRLGVVIGMPWRRVVIRQRGWVSVIVIPCRLLRPLSPGFVTSIGPLAGESIRHRAAALLWLTTAPPPTVSTAARQRASKLSCAWPTA